MNPVQERAEVLWQNARRKAFWNELFSALNPSGNDLLSFHEVEQRLNLRAANYRGVRSVPLNHIVGSVGRYHEFNRAFMPLREMVKERWMGVAKLNLRMVNGGAPPIELFAVGDWYFVRDGNHRVSVAHQLGYEDIEAHVWEYSANLPKDTRNLKDVDQVLLEGERREFFHITGLHMLRPTSNVQVTLPGGYLEFLRQITYYHKALEKIDAMTIPFAEAVTGWYDMQFEPVAQLIQRSGVMSRFPNRTVADFFVWVHRERVDLSQRYGRKLSYQETLRVWRNPLRRFLSRLFGKGNRIEPRSTQ